MHKKTNNTVFKLLKRKITHFELSSRTSILLWLGLLKTSMSLSYFLVIVPVDGVDSRDSSRLVAEPSD